MNPSSLLVNAVLHGVLGGGRKQSRRATRYLTGDRGMWANPSMLLTAAGLAWGVFETMEQSGTQGSRPLQSTGPAPSSGDASLPPLPRSAPAPSAAPAIEPQALRMIRLAISAANADGSMNDQERSAVVRQAEGAGLADFAERELARPLPLRDIVADVKDAHEAATLYVLAFSILRADESVRPTERVFLAQLASLLALERSTVEALERNAGERIDALGDQGQLGG